MWMVSIFGSLLSILSAISAKISPVIWLVFGIYSLTQGAGFWGSLGTALLGFILHLIVSICLLVIGAFLTQLG